MPPGADEKMQKKKIMVKIGAASKRQSKISTYKVWLPLNSTMEPKRNSPLAMTVPGGSGACQSVIERGKREGEGGVADLRMVWGLKSNMNQQSVPSLG
jgi:hypothetical protein